MKKKFLSLLVGGVLMVASLTGCGQDAKATDDITVGMEEEMEEEVIVYLMILRLLK